MKWKALQMPERITADESVATERFGDGELFAELRFLKLNAEPLL